MPTSANKPIPFPRAVAGRIARCVALAGTLVVLTLAAVPAQIPAGRSVPAVHAAPTSGTAEQVVVARVNGEPITRADQDRIASRIVYQQLRMLGSGIANIPTEQIEALRAKAKEQALEQLVNVRLVMQAKQKANLSVTDAQIERQKKQLRTLLEQRKLTYEQYLAQTGKTDEDLTRELRDQLQIEQLLESRTGELEPTEQQQKDYYEQNKQKLAEPPKLRTSHILIKFPGDPRDLQGKPVSDAEKAPLRKKAEEVLTKLKAGGDFAELAKQYSGCPSAPKGGDLGSHVRGQMVPAYDDAAWAMKVGDVSGIVESPFGYHIIKVTGKEEGGVPGFDDAKQRIHTMLTQQRFNDAMDSLLEELRKSAKVEILVKEAAPSKPPRTGKLPMVGKLPPLAKRSQGAPVRPTPPPSTP
jgi:peptidyl-prolyl cis-trans isomerase C